MTDHTYSATTPEPAMPAAPADPSPPRDPVLTPLRRWQTRSGKAKIGILMWLLGVPIPLILLFFLIRSCVS